MNELSLVTKSSLRSANVSYKKCLADKILTRSASDPLPDNISLDDLDEIKAHYESLLSPCRRDYLAAYVVKFMKYCNALGMVEDKNVEMMAEIYCDDLCDLPQDLVEKALGETRRSWTYSKTLPTPGIIREKVRDDLARRKLAVNKIKTAEMQVNLNTKHRKVISDTVKKRDMTQILGKSSKAIPHD